jgi:hypothetical protein
VDTDVRSNVVAAGLIAVMVLGSMVLWLVVPVAWLWLASQIDKSIEASFRAYVVIAIGVPSTMLLLFSLLRRLDLFHQRITGNEHRRRLAPAWRRSLSDERNLMSETSARPPRST